MILSMSQILKTTTVENVSRKLFRTFSGDGLRASLAPLNPLVFQWYMEPSRGNAEQQCQVQPVFTKWPGALIALALLTDQ